MVTQSIVIILLALLLFISIKCLSYYCATCGLMYHIETELHHEISGQELKKITEQATRRVIHDFFNKG